MPGGTGLRISPPGPELLASFLDEHDAWIHVECGDICKLGIGSSGEAGVHREAAIMGLNVAAELTGKADGSFARRRICSAELGCEACRQILDHIETAGHEDGPQGAKRVQNVCADVRPVVDDDVRSAVLIYDRLQLPRVILVSLGEGNSRSPGDVLRM